ncbi:hypothetical protein KIW84_054899 [Lathyrus oleraceus]|uniref:DUF659 domain-containing protein n=1 Tax=Pisum sativum TaxID=3888 RepID=A0A9D5AKP8_PEA|nr:hypothetical protein KIW84_054899 [Pisum sativum]
MWLCYIRYRQSYQKRSLPARFRAVRPERPLPARVMGSVSGTRIAADSGEIPGRVAHPGRSGTIGFNFKKTKNINLNDVCDKEARARTVQYIARFVYTCGIAFDVANGKAFKLMLEAVGSYGPHLKSSTFHELRVPLLQKELEYTKCLLKNHKVQKNKYGCSIMLDGWTDRKGKTLINFFANCLAGTVFVKNIAASDYAKTGDKLAELLDTFVEEIGEQNVVQLIIDNGSNYVATDKILTSKRPNMFWTPYATQCINLVLEDIGKIPKFDKVIKYGVKVVGYIYNHTFALNLMRKITDNIELVKN